MEYVRLYEDEAGNSHFEDVEISLASADLAPPAPPLDLSSFVEAKRFAFLRAPTRWLGGWHPAPTRQFLVIMNGVFEVSVSDGETRRLGPGAVLLVEDTSGKGHVTRVLGEGEASAAIVQL